MPIPAPIQTVNAFSEAELWYMYQQLVEINGYSQGNLTQLQLWQVFEGTNPQGKAESLFENQTLNRTSIADILYFSNNYLSVIDNNVGDIKNLIDTKTSTATLQTTGNNSLSSIDTKLTSQATATNQTTANNYLNLIDAQTSDIASHTQTTNTYLSALRTPVIISTSASATISGQLHNVSFYNSGSSAGTITVNGTTVNLPAGVTVNYDAGGNNNRFATNTFGYNATGTTFIISYVN